MRIAKIKKFLTQTIRGVYLSNCSGKKIVISSNYPSFDMGLFFLPQICSIPDQPVWTAQINWSFLLH
jgi:hypothetical protein